MVRKERHEIQEYIFNRNVKEVKNMEKAKETKRVRKWAIPVIIIAILISSATTMVLLLDPYDWYHHYEVEEYKLFEYTISGIYARYDGENWLPNQSPIVNAFSMKIFTQDYGYYIQIKMSQDWALYSSSFSFWLNGTTQTFNCSLYEGVYLKYFKAENNTNSLIFDLEQSFKNLIIDIYIVTIVNEIVTSQSNSSMKV